MNREAGRERRSHVGERVVAAFLLAAVAVLGWIRFHLIPERAAPSRHEFDLQNPLLDAEVGDCVVAQSTSSPG